MIQLDLSILNQKGTPMFNSDIFANRPTFGIVGRIFISTDTSQIFRDTGTSYVLISDTSSGGTITGSGTTGTLPLWSGSNSLGNSTLIEAATQISTTKSIKANALFLNDATLGTGAIYYNVAANRLTLANYNVGGIIRFETNGGTNAGTIDASQNLSITGTITGSSIIKSGGLSSQFLKADGSVDPSAYIVLGSISATSPLSYNNSTGVFTISQASTSTNGYLSSTDWNTFNSKQATLSLTTIGSSGAATLIGATLNIPNYANLVTSVFGRTGVVVATNGDYTTTQVTEGTNLYFLDSRARAAISAGVSISYNSTTGVITNSAPDQVVALTASTGISVSGTYPNFTITNTQPSSGGTITGTGTTGTLPLWSGSTSLGDSLITQSGSNITSSAKTFVSNTFTAISLLNPLALSVGTNNTFDAGITWPSLEPCDNVEFLQNNNYNGNITYLNSNYTANNLILSGFQFLSASTTITSNQTTGIRALSNQILQARINGSNNGTITHFANSLVYGDFAASTARFNFTNRYGYLVNNLDEYGAGHTYTNRYAFYNQGASDHNYFAGKMLLNTLTVTSDQLSVVGTTLLNGALSGTSATFSNNVSVLGLTVNSVSTFSSLATFNGNISLGGISTLFSNGTVTLNGALSGTSATFSGDVTSGGQSQNLFIANGNTYSGFKLSRGGVQKWSIFNNNAGTDFFDIYNYNTNSSSLTIASTGAATFSSSVYSGISSINASAQLQADSTTLGFLPPRMTTTQKNAIAAPAAGLIVYDSTLNKLCVRTAAAWETITSI